jgi:hypothetical protein
MKRTVKRKTSHRRKTHHRRYRGGVAPVNYSLSGDWSSRMSLGQGADYFKYHEGQHGGMAGSPFPGAVVDSTLPPALRGPAHLGGIDKAISDVRGLCDPPNCPTAPPMAPKVGGRRKKAKKSKKHRKNKSKKNGGNRRTKRNKKTRGGSLGFAPFPSRGMLLDSPKAYAQAGLNPEWKTAVEFTDAKIRDTQ